MKQALQALISGRDLTPDEATGAFEQLMNGEADLIQAAGLLVGLQVKGITSDELAAAAASMRRHVVPIDIGDVAGVVDTCGTGGTGSGTFNVSTAAALVAAACGVRVVKHGNRAATSQSGSADVLEKLGVSLDADPRQQLDASGIAFAYARNHHPAMRHVAPVRRALLVPTVFNILGPLTSPAGVKRQLLGVYSPHMTEIIAGALLRLGSERAWALHSEDGQDDLSCAVPTRISEVKNGEVFTWTFDPAPYGLVGGTADLQAPSPAASAELIRKVFAGEEEGPARDAIALYASAAAILAGGAEDTGDALDVATGSIASGRAAETLEKLAAVR